MVAFSLVAVILVVDPRYLGFSLKGEEIQVGKNLFKLVKLYYYLLPLTIAFMRASLTIFFRKYCKKDFLLTSSIFYYCT